MITVSGICMCDKCEARTRNIYRMIGYCTNCGREGILMLFRAGDPKRNLDCPACGVWQSVKPQRFATDEAGKIALDNIRDSHERLRAQLAAANDALAKMTLDRDLLQVTLRSVGSCLEHGERPWEQVEQLTRDLDAARGQAARAEHTIEVISELSRSGDEGTVDSGEVAVAIRHICEDWLQSRTEPSRC